ncbi:sugar phosphate isomerase/epimerase family protein [Flectobacillus roseus]|uniref:sugar phosphate isomerase/epimerase family protein n=1 Tax=Flectobacillus roseus TaxID=502259 RepID=UPI00286E69BE|nr:sugar phosphate isomerase/epimerase family protein [Flectobacillus roseus]
MIQQTRRDFLKKSSLGLAGLALSSNDWLTSASKPFYEISLAEWSLHKTIFSGKLSNLDFPQFAKKEFGLEIVEYVNQFFPDKAKDKTYLKELRTRSVDEGIRNHLIMIDAEGELGEADTQKRKQAVENHYKWVEAAQFLGCQTIRVNSRGEGDPKEVAKRCVESLRTLSEFGKAHNINIIVENHGGYSANGAWLAGIMKEVGMKNCGTLPDFGNFCLEWSGAEWHSQCKTQYDPYKGTAEMMPYAKGVSAKTFNFDAKGNEPTIDYIKMMKVIKKSGFRGIVGIEYEGETLSEIEGIKKTIALLKKSTAAI